MTITAEVSCATTGSHDECSWPSLLKFHMPLDIIQEVSDYYC